MVIVVSAVIHQRISRAAQLIERNRHWTDVQCTVTRSTHQSSVPSLGKASRGEPQCKSVSVGVWWTGVGVSVCVCVHVSVYAYVSVCICAIIPAYKKRRTS